MSAGIMTPRAQAYQRLRRATHASSYTRNASPSRQLRPGLRVDATAMLHESAVFSGRSGDRVVMSLMTHPRFRDGVGHLQATIVADPREGTMQIDGVDIFKSELHVNGHRINAIFLPLIEGVSTLISANVSAHDFILDDDEDIMRIDLILSTRNAELGRLHLVQMIAQRQYEPS